MRFSPKGNTTVKDIFIGWLQRDFDFPLLEAHKEYSRIVKCDTRKDYLRVSRVGSCVALTRALRNSIYSTYENAQNHASIIEEMQK